VPGETFRKAFLKLKDEHGLYRQESNASPFSPPPCSRPRSRLPAEVPTGTYEIRGEAVRGRNDDRAHALGARNLQGRFEQFVTSSAQYHGLLYGLATSLMAILTGWFASVVFAG